MTTKSRSDLQMEILRRALKEMCETDEFNYHRITDISGVSNIKRIIDGQGITVENWKKLHKTFPQWIPEPKFEDGTNIYDSFKDYHGANIIQGKGHIRIDGTDMSSALQHLVQLLQTHDKDGALTNKFVIEVIQFSQQK